MAHGGVVAALLDEACGQVVRPSLSPAVTSRLEVRYIAPVPVEEPLRVFAELTALDELREAGRHVQKAESHTGRNVTLLVAGITLGVLFNPMTGADTRKWIREKVFGPEEPFESYQSSGDGGS